MAYKIDYKSSVIKDLKKIDKTQCNKLVSRIEIDLSNNPEKGKALQGEYKGLFSYRMGDYRVIYTVVKDSVLILKVAHRKEVYKFIV